MIFEEIYELYWQKIFRLCMGYVNDPELAQDLAQKPLSLYGSSFRNSGMNPVSGHGSSELPLTTACAKSKRKKIC